MMACKRHHDQIDGKRRPVIVEHFLTEYGANGRMRFDCEDGTSYEEPR